MSVAVLPEDLSARLHEIGRKLDQQESIVADYFGVVDGLNALPPTLALRAAPEIVEAARLFRWRRETPSIVRLFSPRLTDDEQLRTVSGLEFLFLFHGDGHIREAALRKINQPIPSAFVFVALASRLNDWVAQVRAAAVECAERSIPATGPDVIAQAAMVLLGRDSTWGRWREERKILDWAFARPDVAEKMADILVTTTTGPSPTILHHALRSGSMDPHLERLARAAIQPTVRATAATALINGFTSWPNGWRWRWIDKSMGIRRAETVFENRDLTMRADRVTMIEAALQDRSAAVRNSAVSGLIRFRDEFREVRALAEPLLNDRSRRVRERAAFLLRTHPIDAP